MYNSKLWYIPLALLEPLIRGVKVLHKYILTKYIHIDINAYGLTDICTCMPYGHTYIHTYTHVCKYKIGVYKIHLPVVTVLLPPT